MNAEPVCSEPATRELLHDHLDGELADDDRARVDRHLAGCPACREHLEGLRRLTSLAASLPRDLPPATVDLDWAALEPQLGAHPAPVPARRVPLAPAALVLLALAAGVLLGTRVPVPRPSAPDVAEEPAPVPETPALQVLQAAVEELEGELAASDLGPGERAVVMDNLAVIDRAVAEIRDALAARPGDRELEHTLARVYRRKVDLLRHATQVAGG